jgi:hypothetical protein
MGMLLIVSPFDFLVVLFSFFVLRSHVEHSKLSFQSIICVFFGHDEGKKRYRYFDLIT